MGAAVRARFEAIASGRRCGTLRSPHRE